FLCLILYIPTLLSLTFLFTTPATSDIYTLSLHDALPISLVPKFIELVEQSSDNNRVALVVDMRSRLFFNEINSVLDQIDASPNIDRKSTRLNSSHVSISYAVFCLKKKK